MQNFSFDDWFDNYMRNDNFYKDYFQEGVINQPSVQQAIAEEKERVRPYVEKYLENWKIQKEFGSSLDGDFRGKCYYLRKN